jgi:four helix bundle protein
MGFVGIYRASSRFPREEVYGLTNQLRRAAVSIPANIEEGDGQTSKREFSQFLSIAYGSLREAETHILIAERLGYVDSQIATDLMTRAAEIGRLLNGLKRSLLNPR